MVYNLRTANFIRRYLKAWFVVSGLGARSSSCESFIYGVGTSLDGQIARLDGSLDFLHLRPSNYSMGPFFKTIDVGLMGRKTYEAGVRMGGGKFESHGLRCFIFSRSLPEGEHEGPIFVSQCPKRVVEELRKEKEKEKEKEKDIWLIGGELCRFWPT